MSEFNRILTAKDAEELSQLFINDDEVKEVRKFISERLASKKDWRQYGHYKIYDLINYHKGILDKVNLARKKISCSSGEEVISMLYIMGYALKRIIYIVWQMGYLNMNANVIRKFIKANKWKLAPERQKFLEHMEQVKVTVFQDCQEQVKAAEAETVNIYIKQIHDLNSQLSEIDITVEPSRARSIRKDIKEIMETLLSVHGINNIREWSIKIQGEKELMAARKTMEIPNGGGLPALGKTINQGNMPVSGANFLEG